jgi:hypothetical protein
VRCAGAADVVVDVDDFVVDVVDFAGVFAAPEVTLVAATLGFDFDSADTVVSPVDALSTGVVGVAAIADVVDAESDAVVVLSAFALSLRAHAVAKLSTLPTSTARPSSERDGDTGSSKQRFIDMLIHSCTLP